MRVEDQSGHIYVWTKIDCLKSLHQGTLLMALSVVCYHLAYSDTQELGNDLLVTMR